MTTTVDIRAGAVYLSAAVVDRYFRGTDAVVVLIRGGAVHILPVRQMASGGCLLKIRNRLGDRVASAPDVFHANGLGTWEATDAPAYWSDEHGALVIPLLQTWFAL